MLILSSKATRPAPTPQIFERPRLYAVLDRWRATPVIFIHAPAGYGKSVLASRWIEVRGLASVSAWLSLDPGDDAPVQFVQYLAAALEPVVPGITSAVEPILNTSEPHPMRALEVMLSRIEQAPNEDNNAPILLVLDDLHHIDSSALAPLMTEFLERRPARLHLMLLGRLATYAPLVRQYAAGRVLEISEVELAFQPDEVEAYLAQHGFDSLAPETLARLTVRTEGWIIALQLAVAAIGNRRDLEELLAATQSRQGWLADYLITQILADLSPAKRAFLLKTSILERFNTSLAAAVTGIKTTDDLLSAMIGAGLPIVQLDSQWEWFRYHHLVQELLQTQLQQKLDDATIANLHRSAATWLAQHDQVATAVQHTLIANDSSLAASILETAVRPEILRGGTHQAETWLALFPASDLDQQPRLLLDLCLLRMLRVQANLADLVARADAALASARLADEERQRAQDELTIYTIYAQFYLGNFARVKELVRDADQRFVNTLPLTMGWLRHIQMHLAWYEGRTQTALVNGQQAIDAFRDAGFDHAVIAIRRNLAQITANDGNGREALAMHREVVAAAQPNSSFAINELAETHASAMSLCYWLDDIEGAQCEQQSALALARRLADPVLTCEIEALAPIFAMARAPGQTSEIQDSHPLDTMGAVLPLNRLYLHQLVRQGQVERAWHLAAGFGVQVDGEISPQNLAYFVSLLKVIIARGADLESITPRIRAAMAQAARVRSQFLATEICSLSAWCHLQLGRQEEAERDLHRALDLAQATGYVRFILDIPALAPLLAVQDHPTAAKMWAATVSAELRQQAAQLTHQERLVLAHLTQPGRYQDIADSLGVSLNTVRTHIRHLYAKLGVNKRKDAVAMAYAFESMLASMDDLQQ